MSAQVILFVKTPPRQIQTKCSFCGAPVEKDQFVLRSGDARKVMCMPCATHAKARMEEEEECQKV